MCYAATAAGRLSCKQLPGMFKPGKKLGGLEITEAGDIEAAKDKSQHSTPAAKVAQVCVHARDHCCIQSAAAVGLARLCWHKLRKLM